MVTIYYDERIQMNQPKEERHRARCGEVSNGKYLLSSGCITLMVSMCDNIHGVLPTGECSPKLWCPVFIGASLHRHEWLID